MLTKGYAAPETKAAFDRASALIERAQALGEAPEDPLTLFSVVYGFWVVNFIAFNGEAMRELAGQFLALAEKQSEIVPLMIGHRLMGTSLVFTGDIAEGRAHYDQAIALYDPAVHRPLATRFGHDVRVVILCQRSFALWHLGYPESALADADYAVRDARELGHAAALMYALYYASLNSVLSRNYAAANALLDELIALAEEKGASFWRASAMIVLGDVLTEIGNALAGRQMIASGIVALQSTGGTVGLPRYLCNLAYANSELGNYEEAWRYIGEAPAVIETTKQTLNEAEVHYVAGEIALKSSEDTKAVAHLEQAIAVARAQQAKSIELRATMSMARLWRDQGKRQALWHLSSRTCSIWRWGAELLSRAPAWRAFACCATPTGHWSRRLSLNSGIGIIFITRNCWSIISSTRSFFVIFAPIENCACSLRRLWPRV
jgi:tetratricopeptide (TPR) repeat protein